ncbi:MAG: N-acetyl-gamma-glutamyl-phosphate reductase [Deltaproteobacteria bacterium]
MKIRVGVLGATGYTGAALLGLLINHPGVSVVWLTSEKFAGRKIQEVFPHLRNFLDTECRSVARLKELEKVDLAFSCLPQGTSMHFASKMLDSGARVIDFSADFRFSRIDVYEGLFKTRHKFRAILKEAVYGLPELFKEEIRGARIVANPGCYSTGVILGTAPLVKNGLIKQNTLIADAKSGDSGGGRAPTLEHHFPEINENSRVNSAASANQRPEMEEVLSGYSDSDYEVTFLPHIIPVNRGILTTIYARLNRKADPDYIYGLYNDFFRGEPFIRLYGRGRFPELKHVSHSNLCGIGLGFREDVFISIVALDNLLKGAAGQAVQNMNIMFDFPETESLNITSLYP